MPRHRKYVQYNAAGCKICGDKTVGRGTSKHVEGEHLVPYDAYKKCFESGKVVVDTLEESGKTGQGKKVMIHVLVRRFFV